MPVKTPQIVNVQPKPAMTQETIVPVKTLQLAAQLNPVPHEPATTMETLISEKRSSKKRRRKVELPNPIPYVELLPSLAEVLNLIIGAGPAGINTLELQEEGICSATKKVSRLRKAGAHIETILFDAFDARGNRHQTIAHYFYHSWDKP